MHMIFTICIYGKVFNELPGFLCISFEAQEGQTQCLVHTRQAYISESHVQSFLLAFNGEEVTCRMILPERGPIRLRREHLSPDSSSSCIHQGGWEKDLSWEWGDQIFWGAWEAEVKQITPSPSSYPRPAQGEAEEASCGMLDWTSPPRITHRTEGTEDSAEGQARILPLNSQCSGGSPLIQTRPYSGVESKKKGVSGEKGCEVRGEFRSVICWLKHSLTPTSSHVAVFLLDE